MTAAVDIGIPLETLKTPNLQLGEWVNVIGYVHAEPKPLRANGASISLQNTKAVPVQAIMVWSAGSLKIDAYEQAAVAKTEQDSRMSSCIGSKY